MNLSNFYTLMVFAVVFACWALSIKNQVKKNHHHRQKQRPIFVPVHHTPSGGVPAQQ